MTQVSTSLNLYLNTTANSSIQVKYGQFINVSAQYRNIIDSVYITDPLTTVTVTGGSLGIISWTLAAVGSYWQYNLDSRLLGTPTSYTMTISASLANYTISPKVFTIQVIEVPTTMINVNGSAITVMWRSIFRIYVAYRTYTGTAVPGAIMSTTTANVGTGFNTTHYWAEFNATAFGSIQVHNLGISLSRANYTGQSVTISVDVRAITTTAQTFQSAGNAATDFSVYWLNTIDVIVQYTDTVHAVNITSTTISAGIYNGAIVSNTYASGNYTLRFSSTLLGNPGVYVISLSISRATFESKIIVITIQVNEPTTSLIVTDVNGNSLSGASVSWGEPFVFVARLWDSVHSANITGWTASFSRPPIGNVVSGPNRTITYNWLTPGIYTITVTGVLDPYPSASAAITLVVNTITTELRSYAYNGGLSDTFTSSWGSTINVTLQYRNTFNSTIINPALASITTTSASKVISTVQNVQNKTFLFNASLFVPGVYTINFEASRTNYNYDSVAITFTVTSLNTTLETYEVLSNVVSHSFVATWGTLVSFDVAFNQTGTQVAYARVPGVISAAPAWTSSANSPVGGKLRVTYDTSLFAAPSINSITITAQYQNRTIRSISVTLTINTVSTRISTFNAVNVNTTSFNVFWNENVAIDVMYQTISGTNITTLPATIITTTPLVPASMVDSLIYPGRKTLTFSTSTLTAQTYQVTITARLQNYTASSIYILINVQTRTTNATVHSTSGPEQYSFNVYYGDMLNVDVRYYDMLNGTSISNAGGATISSTPAESANGANGIYRRLTYNTASFTLGLHMVLISCSRGARYAEAQVVIFITVQAVPTRVSIFNATSGAPSTAFKATWNTLFQVSVAFDRTYAPVGPLPGATFVVNVPYQSVSYAAGRYLFTFNSSRIGSPDIYSITFTASLANYVTSANSSTLEVLRVSTVLQSYAQGGGLKAQFSIEWGKILTFTGRYHLALSPFTALHPTSMTPLNFPGSIILGNVGNGENITFSMNSSSFGGTGIFTSTFIMSRTNYTENSMQVTIEVVALDSRVNLLINSTSSPSLTNITVSRQYYVPFENLITIRVQYLTQLGSMPISNARVMVRFIERSINWTNYPGGNNTISNKSNGQYDLTLNTLDDLGDFGQYSFVVVISKQNYTMESEPFYVYPIKLQTKLDIFTSTWANVTNGQKFTVNFTKSLVLYCALWDISKSKYINTTYGVVFTAVMKGVTYTPVTIYTNGTALFRFNTSAINVDVGTSNFISFTGSAGIYNPSGGSVNLEVLTVPTLARAFNSTTGSSVIQGSTIPLYYTRNFTIDVSYTDILNSANITNLNTGARIYAKVYAQEINATWVGGGKWRILFDSNTMPVTTGSIPQITIYGTYVNYTTATFLFNLWLREINTTITVYNDLRPYGGNLVKINDSIEVNWSDSVTLVVYYNNTLTNLPIGTWGSPSTYPLVQATFGISPVYTNTGLFSPALYSQVDIDSSWLRGGNTHTIIVTGNKQNFIGAEFRFNLVVKEVPTRLYVMNDSGYLTEGQTVQIYYGDTLHLNASYQNLITGANVSIAGPTIRAVILGTAINAVNLFNGNWSIDINTGIIVGLRSGSTPQIVVTATYLNHSQATFSFNMQVLDIPTDLIIPTQFQSVVQFIWGQAFAFSVKYNDTHNNLLINGSLVSNYPSMSITFNGSDYMLVFNTTSIGAPGIYRITLTASKQNYASASYTITVQILEVPTNMVVLFNGLTFIQVSLKQNLTIAVNYTRSSDGSPVQGALVTLSFTNDTSGTLLPYTLIYVSGLYVTTIPLDLATFYAQPKFMIVQAFRANYTIGKSNPVVDLRPIEIIGHQNQNLDDPAQTLITGLVPGSTITFDFQLFDNSTDLGWLNASQLVINITCAELHIYNQQMGYVGNGTFRDTIELPSGYDKTYTIILDVYAPGELTRQFRFQNTYTYRFQTETYTGSVIPEWVFYLILAALIGVVIYFVLYQVRFKYPPIVRKIHDLQRNVRRGRAAAKIAPQRVASREEGIYSEFAKILDEYSFLATHAKAMGAKAKEAKAKKGYVAPEEDTLAKEFDLAPKEKVIEIKSVAPAIFPKEGPKKYTELPSIPAPAATPALPAIPKPAAPVVSVPFAPAVPKPAAPAIPGPVTPAMPKIPAIPEVPGTKKVASIAALPKPAAKPLPTKPGAAPEGEGQEGLYGELVKLEQKKYKAQRSLRDLKAKKDKGILTDEEFQQYQVKFEEALEKINEKIAEIRRKLVNF
nr:hypothetical protein [Candidatus Sigynarchaeota archaeon]